MCCIYNMSSLTIVEKVIKAAYNVYNLYTHSYYLLKNRSAQVCQQKVCIANPREGNECIFRIVKFYKNQYTLALASTHNHFVLP